MSVQPSQPHFWRSFLIALPIGLGVPLICLKLWSTAITANPNWHGGLFYFPTTFLELICLLGLFISASPFLLAMVIGVGVVLPLFQSIDLAHQQSSLPIGATAIPTTSDLDFILVLCFAGSVQIIAWTIVIDRIRSKRNSPKESLSSG